MLDMSAFGGAFGGMTSAPASEQQQQQQQQASGGFDLSAFGDFGGAAAAPEPELLRPAPPAADPMSSGMLDLAAFGMGLPPPAEPQQAERAAAAAADMGSGLLDLAAFGMALPTPDPMASGQLDLGAFGMGFAPPPPAPVPSSPPPTAAARPAAQAPAQPAGPAREEPLPPPPQRVVAVAALQPLPAGVAAQLRGLLESREEEGEDASFDDHPFPARFSQPGGGGSGGGPGPGSPWGGPRPSEPIPGLSLPETSAVLALAAGLSPAEPTGQGPGLRLRPGGPQPDEAAGQALLCLAVALSQRGDGSGEAAEELAMRQAMGMATSIKNAAGVGFALPPSATAGPAGAAAPQGPRPLAREWGLLPGLDAPAVLWGVLSGESSESSGQPAPLP